MSETKTPVGGDRHNNGRGATKFSFTYKDIAEEVNLSIRTVRLHVRTGVFNPNKLLSLLKYIKKKREDVF